ncbi:MAG: nucleotide exchange factor GrpE [Fibrobacteraceae bacterium]|jgi:molecular chaperone GrpE|nr:nucleotide exchange factor GrpE [Fibrobacteraceae bacterium]
MSAEEKDLSEELIREAENAANSNSTEEASQETSEKDSTQTESASETSEIDSIKAELIAAQDRNLRLMAEFDNFRRRTAKEQLDLIETANAKLLEKLSEVLDNFERAFAAENKANDLEAFEKGMQLIHTQFAKTLTDAGLEQIDPVGQEFDPNCQEALMQQPSEEIPEGHVVTVFQKGYRLKGKILKTAKVIVSSGK